MSGTVSHAPPIAAHRLLGDGSATALLRPGGEVDWWCAPDLDSPPVLWSLLDPDGASARWRDVRLSSAAGRAAGPVLSTVLQSTSGRIECRDALHCDDDRGTSLIRLVRGLDADLDLVHEVALGGFDQPWAEWDDTTTHIAGHAVRVLGGTSTPDGRWLRTRVTARLGEWAAVVVTFDPLRTADVDTLIGQLDAAGREDDDLVASSTMPGIGADRVADALRVLRLCTYASTGAVVAAVTTSLPEVRGHDRQFDYRFSWLRDASLAVSVAALLGRADVAEQYLRFVVGRAEGGPLPHHPMSDVRGGHVPEEREVPGVAGWAGSLPIRVGNAAADQIQYDALGLLLEAVSVHLRHGGRLGREVWSMVRAVADDLSGPLEDETSGIWELREPRRLLSADIGVWIALDRAVSIARRRRPWTRRRPWIGAREAARDRVLAAIGPDGGLPQTYDGDAAQADASALMVVVFGMLGRHDPRASALVDATVRALDCFPFLYRYEPGGADGFSGTEGAFLPASWWVVSALAACGQVDAARARFAALDAAVPALQPEEVDPERREGLGNVPLVWSHMEAARAAYLLDDAVRRQRRVTPIVRRMVASFIPRRTRR